MLNCNQVFVLVSLYGFKSSGAEGCGVGFSVLEALGRWMLLDFRVSKTFPADSLECHSAKPCGALAASEADEGSYNPGFRV